MLTAKHNLLLGAWSTEDLGGEGAASPEKAFSPVCPASWAALAATEGEEAGVEQVGKRGGSREQGVLAAHQDVFLGVFLSLGASCSKAGAVWALGGFSRLENHSGGRC